MDKYARKRAVKLEAEHPKMDGKIEGIIREKIKKKYIGEFFEELELKDEKRGKKLQITRFQFICEITFWAITLVNFTMFAAMLAYTQPNPPSVTCALKIYTSTVDTACFYIFKYELIVYATITIVPLVWQIYLKRLADKKWITVRRSVKEKTRLYLSVCGPVIGFLMANMIFLWIRAEKHGDIPTYFLG